MAVGRTFAWLEQTFDQTGANSNAMGGTSGLLLGFLLGLLLMFNQTGAALGKPFDDACGGIDLIHGQGQLSSQELAKLFPGEGAGFESGTAFGTGSLFGQATQGIFALVAMGLLMGGGVLVKVACGEVPALGGHLILLATFGALTGTG